MRRRLVIGGTVAALGAAAAFFSHHAEVLALQLPTRVLAPTHAEVTTPRAALEHFQCNRCHVVEGVAPPSAPLAENCVTCHQAILAGRLDLWYREERVTAWREHLVHLVRTPDLSTLRWRVTRAWLVTFLQAPHPVRPLAGAMMPRLPIGPREAALLADALGVVEPPSGPPSRGDASRGEALYRRRGCGACHARGDARDLRYGAPEFREASVAQRRAPDLAWVPQRMSEAQLRVWLTAPAQVQPDTEMPPPGFTADELDDVAAFLWRPPLRAPPAAPRAPRLLDRRVTWAEVSAKLSRHLCFHCHSDGRRPGDRGPGNSGGFGYAGAGLDLATREGVLRGVRRDGGWLGQPDRLAEGMPRLVASLLARRAEVQGLAQGEVLGMPLGLPPLPDEDIDLVYTWLEQGSPE